MKNLVKSLFVLTLLFAAFGAGAQMQKRTPEERAQNQTKWIQKNLGTTDDQTKKAYDIILRYAREAEDAMNAQGSDRRQQMQGIQNNRDAELKTVLNADQYQKYITHMQEMQEKMRERRAGGMQQGG